MSTHTSSIDDVLATSHLPVQDRPIAENIPDVTDEKPSAEPDLYGNNTTESVQPDTTEPDTTTAPSVEYDDYGNERSKSEKKLYTEEEVNEQINRMMRERFERMERKTQNVPAENTQLSPTNSSVAQSSATDSDWQQQLSQFVEQTVSQMGMKQQQEHAKRNEEFAQHEFELKFHNGMSKFKDFREVVGANPITDAMTMATRSMADPAAFLYAASKRHTVELQRISKIADPYAQMVAIGKLEERMIKAKSTTTAPRPLESTKSDMSFNSSKDNKEPSIETMIAQSDAKRLQQMRERRR